MEMYLAKVPVYTIMLIGRWLSNTFLHYVQKQVKQFSKDVAKKMMMHCSFWTIPNAAPCMVSNKDPQQCNHWDNTETRKNIGCNMSWRGQLPAISFFNWSSNNMEQLMAEALHHHSLKVSEEGRVEIKISIPNPTPTSAHLVHFSLIHVLRRSLASKLIHWQDADRGERENGDWQTKKN